MAGMSRNSQDEAITGINITPMVDVMLVLLMIFMMAAPAIYKSGMDLDLPQAKSGSKTDRITLNFTLKKDGQLLLDSRPIQSKEMISIVKKTLEMNPQSDAMLAADRSLAHGDVILVLDQIKQAGLKRVSIAVAGSSS